MFSPVSDISPPSALRAAMELQAEAERRKRASILESEGLRESKINAAEGERQRRILESQGILEVYILPSDPKLG